MRDRMTIRVIVQATPVSHGGRGPLEGKTTTMKVTAPVKHTILKTLSCAVVVIALGWAFALPAGAQEVLPKLEPAFKGTIGKTYKD